MNLLCFSFYFGTGSRRAWGRVGGFTLLETLVVVTIIAILVGLTAGVTGAISGSRGSTAVQQVAAFLDEARAKALTGEGEVMVAFATEAVSVEGAPYRAVAIYRRRPGGGTAERKLEPLSGWFYLPPGFVFSDGGPADAAAGVNVFQATDAVQRVVLPGANAVEVGLPCIGFRELGEVSCPKETQGRPVLVAVAEGEVAGGRVKNFQGLEHSPDKCRWLAVQKNSGASMILP
jgi:prepilin-type N-terminal cleavage/methylation domain-containing protein